MRKHYPEPERSRPVAQHPTTLPRKAVMCSLLALAGLHSGAGMAAEFVTANGVEVRTSLNASLGTSMRMREADKALIMVGNGGTGGSSHDDGNLNYDKHDTFSTIAKLIGEVSLKRDNVGVFLRAKAWHDFELNNSGVPHGSSANRFTPGAALNDDDFDRLSKFSGVALLDAYASWNTELGEDRPLSIKLGNQVVNWGESLFVSGINQFGAFDLSASRRPGSQVKEILMPIPQVWANLGITDNLSAEAFYQFRWKKNILDGCGTYWSISDVYNCSDRGVNVPAGPLANSPDRVTNANGTAILANAGDIDGKDSGQFGLALRYFSQELATEFGAYAVNYHQRSPVISILFNASPAPSAFASGTSRLQYAWDWSGEDIKVFGLSFSTSLGGWSVFGEASKTKDLPVQLNGLDLLRGASAGVGPLGFLAATPRNANILFTGYERKDKSQFQVSTLKIFPRVLGAESVTLLGEVAYQRWSGIGDPNTGKRYGRAFVYGQATTSTLTNCTAGGAAGAGNPAPAYCENEGFATSSAWGYRINLEGSYPDVMAGVNLKPRVFWSHDVKGYSADSQFVEDRKMLGLGARFDYLGKYYADLSYNRFNRKAKYDTFHDRDFVSAVVGVNF
ncbi:DUF1302 domain-containing protein [Massilia sp. 9I]|uniref:DUF1302 domain-containing protein n=1 Tax=Massilia sp. 9I TaxID=2653152 RepID=UPI0012F34DC8|nr:DUF1302 domain-containing protein [Massilia sp. 9I]VXB13027.1 conserved exported hypothetical protein [Massilia sp. 9I]